MSIHKFFEAHQEWILGVVALALGAIVASIYFWGIADLALDLGKAVAPRQGADSGARFDLDGVKKLDLKGLAQ